MQIYCLHAELYPATIMFGVVGKKRKDFYGNHVIGICIWQGCKCTHEEVIPIEQARNHWKKYLDNGYIYVTKGETEPCADFDSSTISAMKKWGQVNIPVRTDLI